MGLYVDLKFEPEVAWKIPMIPMSANLGFGDLEERHQKSQGCQYTDVVKELPRLAG